MDHSFSNSVHINVKVPLLSDTCTYRFPHNEQHCSHRNQSLYNNDAYRISFVDLPVHVISRILEHVQYKDLLVLRCVSKRCKEFVQCHSNLLRRSSLTIPHEEFLQPFKFDAACALITKLGPNRHLSIIFPTKKPGTVVSVLLCNILKFLFDNVAFGDEVYKNLKSTVEPKIERISTNFDTSSHSFRFSLDFSWLQSQPASPPSPDLENGLSPQDEDEEPSPTLYQLHPYKMWNALSFGDNRLYSMLVGCVDLQISCTIAQKATPGMMNADIKWATITVSGEPRPVVGNKGRKAMSGDRIWKKVCILLFSNILGFMLYRMFSSNRN